MKRGGWKRHLWTLLLAANLALIWGNSMLPGSRSQEVSDGFLRQFAFLPAFLGAYGPKLIRKIAHFAEFACLGLLLAGFFRARGRSAILPGALCGLLSACVDETIQMFSPGRSSSLADVWLDFAGVMTGIFLLHFGHILWTKTRKSLKSEEK
ncbi:MAG: VanZ family protein [Candidatus Faecousia sp.]|nr:VanZ family protein [Candidatus Faecousia sp.]